MTPSLAIESPRQRKARGAYYTPAALVELLLNHVLPTVLETGGRALKILDPACGVGDFLRAVFKRLGNGDRYRLFGVDIDPVAAGQCRDSLVSDGIDCDQLHVEVGDALLDALAVLEPESFDLILGNPPFVNGIEGDLTAEMKAELRKKFPAVRGAADLAHYFLEQAVRLVRPGGRIALVLPRGVLNSPAARNFRANLPAHLRPNLIYAPERCDFFPGAAVFICLLILGPDENCLCSIDSDPSTAKFRSASIAGENWWQALQQAVRMNSPARVVGVSLSSRFAVTASMTAGDAYDVVPHLIDDTDSAGLKLATTGLIDPRRCLWGLQNCRYLRKDYRYPRVIVSDGLTRSLAARAANARRPKIIVAGLARQMEAFLDTAGEYIGAVSTFSIYHPRDDVTALAHLLDHLLLPQTTQHLIDQLGANGLRGRHITVKKSFLLNLPLELIAPSVPQGAASRSEPQ